MLSSPIRSSSLNKQTTIAQTFFNQKTTKTRFRKYKLKNHEENKMSERGLSFQVERKETENETRNPRN